jgi:hypothetical protein
LSILIYGQPLSTSSKDISFCQPLLSYPESFLFDNIIISPETLIDINTYAQKDFTNFPGSNKKIYDFIKQ